MQKVRVAIVGAGNISNTRHIPALKKIARAEIVGAIGIKAKNVERTIKKHRIPNSLVIKNKSATKAMQECDWFKGVDAAVIGAPPRDHYLLVKAALLNNKHVLVEKPMMMSQAECDELIALAKEKRKLFYVMHNFQYAAQMQKLNRIVTSKLYGDIESITEVQFTNHDRRLPEWYNDLPFGLFYDEAAHFLYLLERHAGPVQINNSYAVYDADESLQTPKTLTVNARAGSVPVTMQLNFCSPVCEWYYVVNFKKHILIYDFFKDILIKLPTDNEHYAKDILLNSVRHTVQYWVQFFTNGVKMMMGNLLYGHEAVLSGFIGAIAGEAVDPYLTADNGRTNVISMNEIISTANKRQP